MNNQTKKIDLNDAPNSPMDEIAIRIVDGNFTTQPEAAAYISYIVEELRVVAEQMQMPFLAYLLKLACEEAELHKDPKA